MIMFFAWQIDVLLLLVFTFSFPFFLSFYSPHSTACGHPYKLYGRTSVRQNFFACCVARSIQNSLPEDIVNFGTSIS